MGAIMKKQNALSISLNATHLLGFDQVARVSGRSVTTVESLSRMLSKRGGEVPPGANPSKN